MHVLLGRIQPGAWAGNLGIPCLRSLECCVQLAQAADVIDAFDTG